MKQLNVKPPSLKSHTNQGISIYNLLKNGCPAASHDEIIAAADDARVLDFAWEFREGIHSLVHPDHRSLTQAQEACIENAIVLLRLRQRQLRVS